MKSRLLLSVAALLAVIASCDGPGQYSYMQAADLPADGDGIFWFRASLSDTVSYSSGIAMRYWPRKTDSLKTSFDIYLISPSGEKFIERVDFPLSVAGDDTVRVYPLLFGGVREIEWPYRHNIRINSSDAGIWNVGVEPLGKGVRSAIQGLGFFFREEYGER